jgi:hypothetical protein
VVKIKVPSYVLIAAVVAAAPAFGEDDFPLAGTYVENQDCTAGSVAPRVKITPKEIHSGFGLCSILNRNQDGKTFAIQVECQGAGGNIVLGDVTFTLRDDKTVDFTDQDHVYSAVLHRCPETEGTAPR